MSSHVVIFLVLFKLTMCDNEFEGLNIAETGKPIFLRDDVDGYDSSGMDDSGDYSGYSRMDYSGDYYGYSGMDDSGDYSGYSGMDYSGDYSGYSGMEDSGDYYDGMYYS